MTGTSSTSCRSWSVPGLPSRPVRRGAAARRSSAPSSPARRARPRAPPRSRVEQPLGRAEVRRSARRRTGPTPSSWSNIDSRAVASRRWRWNVIAKRWASSRIRCRSCRPGECSGQDDRLGTTGNEHLLDPLRERDHRDARQVELLHRLQRSRELPLAAVDHDEIRRLGERLVPLPSTRRIGREAREAARDHVGHRGEVVLAVLSADAELAVVRLLRHAVLEHDHRADDLLALDVRDVEALDPDRQRLEVQRLAQLLERLDATQPLRLGDERLRLESASSAFC